MSKGKLVRKEKCLACGEGEVTFEEFEIDGKKEILGSCTKCGYCCGDKQVIY